jgi:2-polyprenyl-6-methoxyphenol hydroxylase-like FAD-dependent oxidoreductase
VRIAINGAGIAGLTLAYWLTRTGHEVLLVEQAPALRVGGYIIDFRGIGYDIAEKMGLIPRITALGNEVREVRFVDDRGRRTGGFSSDVFRRMNDGRFASLRRSDLSNLIYDSLDGAAETLFGNSIIGVEEHTDGVRIRLRRGVPRDVDVVIGADGLHSPVRCLAFGTQSACEVPLGYHVAAFELTAYRPRDELVYVSHAVPGRQVSRFAMRHDKTLFLFVFRDEYMKTRGIARSADRKSLLADVFADVGWECPEILAAMPNAAEIYFERASQIRIKHWTNGRLALVGDAAACVSLLTGEGTGLAMAEAYVLAGALHTLSGHHREAFMRYEECMMPFLRGKQWSAAKFASSFVPKTATGIRYRNVVTGLLHVPAIAEFVIGRNLHDDPTIPLDIEIALTRAEAPQPGTPGTRTRSYP